MKKKRVLITFVVLGLSIILLLGNGKLVFFILNREKKIEQQEIFTISMSTKPIPKIKVEPKITPSNVQEYLEKNMSIEEIEMLYKYADNSPTEASNHTRNFMESEINKKFILTDKYTYDGLHPENSLSYSSKDSFYLDLKTDTFHLPERELTNEELLQYIDFSFKINYALGTRYNNEKPKASTKDITEKEAISKAIKSVEKLFDIDTSQLEISASFLNLGNEVWLVRLSPYKMKTLIANKEFFWDYAVFINSLTGEIEDIKRSAQNYKNIPIGINEKNKTLNDKSWIEEAEKIVIEKYGETRKIIDAKILIDSYDTSNYVLNINETNLKMGYVDVHIFLEDNTSYIVQLLYPNKELKNLSYNSTKG